MVLHSTLFIPLNLRSIDDSIWVEHGDYLEDKGFPQTLGQLVITAQEL